MLSRVVRVARSCEAISVSVSASSASNRRPSTLSGRMAAGSLSARCLSVSAAALQQIVRPMTGCAEAMQSGHS